MDIKIFNKILNKSVWQNWTLGTIILMSSLQSHAGIDNFGEAIVNWNTKKLAQPIAYSIPTELNYSKGNYKENIKNKNIIYSIGIGTSERSKIVAEEEGNIIKTVLSRGSSRKAFKNILWQHK